MRNHFLTKKPTFHQKNAMIDVTTTRNNGGKSESTSSTLSMLEAHQLLLTVLKKKGLNTFQVFTKLVFTHQDDDGTWITTQFEGDSQEVLILHVAFKNHEQTDVRANAYARANAHLLRCFGVTANEEAVDSVSAIKTLDLRAALEAAREHREERAGITFNQRRGYGYAPNPEPNLLEIAKENGLL